jgi:hypothetical protein
MRSFNFTESAADSCIFVRPEESGDITMVVVYVDDLIIVTKTDEKMREIKQNLASSFKMKDLGKLHHCLGITVVQDKSSGCLWLHQKQYILAMLGKFGISQAKTVSTPANPNVKLKINDGVSKSGNPTLYKFIVGNLLYAAVATRPDNSQEVEAVSKYCSNPNESHLTAVKRILRYLKDTIDIALKYEVSKGDDLIGYSDADWARDLDYHRSTSGNLLLLASGPVCSLSKKQPTVALSTAEAEYISLCGATQEAISLRCLLNDFGINKEEEKPTIIREDNQGTIVIAKNPVNNSRAKHIDIKYHYIREKILNGYFGLEYCPTESMITDLLTKPLPRDRFETLRNLMGLHSITTDNNSLK